MATRKRKLPDKKKPVRKEPGFVILAAQASMRLAGRKPSAVVATLGFVVVFGFVSANAFWYQQGRHPSPFLRTRDPGNFSAMLGFNTSAATNPHPDDVTTYLIQRQSTVPAAPPSVAAAVPPQTQPEGLADQKMVLAIQSQLSRLGLYDGPIDGRRSATTVAAIGAYQQQLGLPPSGQPSSDLLAILTADKGQPLAPATDSMVATVRPQERPTAVKTSGGDSVDPVAAAIRSAEKNMVTPPATKASAHIAAPVPKVPVGVAQTDATTGTSLVMDIQRGLINVAYTGITVDGVAGDKTKAAIRHFQRHYRLPETGEPDMAVLKTLKSIGAL
ncbi:peptidoglycan-binding domain-containing protein [Rhizobium sp.]|jgi:peptidoglycan hydrolase-like protein with peptidoglycan-binding domain|uniref:peptidoglycan-binding domain-containing protein n=1 Tax=Rhizobium sp. TaxID=391 RepID=UPI000E91CF13|nr:peptidoglycan-binding protein [Rhizobium sp.]